VDTCWIAVHCVEISIRGLILHRDPAAMPIRRRCLSLYRAVLHFKAARISPSLWLASTCPLACNSHELRRIRQGFKLNTQVVAAQLSLRPTRANM